MVFATDPRVHDSSIPAEVALQMSETASPSVAAEQTAVDDDVVSPDHVVSPELALVDPRLRERLASEPQAEPRFTPAPAPTDEPVVVVETMPLPTSAPAGAPLRVAETLDVSPPAALPPPVPAPIERPRGRRWPVFVAAIVGGALALAATVAFLPHRKPAPETARVVDPSATGHIGRPASSTPQAHVTTALTPTTHSTPPRPTTSHAPARTTHATTTPGATQTTPRTNPNPKTKTKPKTKTNPSAKPPSSSAKTTHDKLAWAPAAGATAYDIDLLKGSKRVFHVRTRQTSIVIAVRTGARGPAGSLPPGEYEWIVWPVVGGQRSAQPIVRSPLKLPS